MGIFERSWGFNSKIPSKSIYKIRKKHQYGKKYIWLISLLTSLPFVSPFSNHSTEILLVSVFILDTTAL